MPPLGLHFCVPFMVKLAMQPKVYINFFKCNTKMVVLRDVRRYDEATFMRRNALCHFLKIYSLSVPGRD